MVGWRILADALKTGGLMNIGLYSELARRHIVRVREEIASLRVGTSESEIRAFRASLAESQNKNHRLLVTSPDFFSLSTLRDLIFHVQEHRFTLPQIQHCLHELGLKFCGFENTDIVRGFKHFLLKIQMLMTFHYGIGSRRIIPLHLLPCASSGVRRYKLIWMTSQKK